MLISATCNHCVTPHGVASVCSKAGPIVCIRFDSDKGVGEKGSSVLIRKLFFGHIETVIVTLAYKSHAHRQ